MIHFKFNCSYWEQPLYFIKNQKCITGQLFQLNLVIQVKIVFNIVSSYLYL